MVVVQQTSFLYRDTNLVHFGYREYDPYTGKWTAKDPIDFSGGTTAAVSTVGGMCMATPELFYLGMRNPVMIGNGLDFIESYLPGVPNMTPYGITGAADNNVFGPNWTNK